MEGGWLCVGIGIKPGAGIGLQESLPHLKDRVELLSEPWTATVSISDPVAYCGVDGE